MGRELGASEIATQQKLAIRLGAVGIVLFAEGKNSMSIDHQEWAEYLDSARLNRKEVSAISIQLNSFDVGDAYAISDAGLENRLRAGETLIGAKLGLTSVAMQRELGSTEPVFGWLTDAHLIDSAGLAAMDELIHPRVEPELVFIMKQDVSGEDITAADILDASDLVVGGIEILDPRFEALTYSTNDVIADNVGCAGVLLGTDGVDPSRTDLKNVGCVFELNGKVRSTTAGAALLGDPALGVAMFAKHLYERGRKIEAGWIIFAGSLTNSLPVRAGHRAHAGYSHLSSLEVQMVPTLSTDVPKPKSNWSRRFRKRETVPG